jgi:beta-lactam-binding protein with PASTA domain
MLTIKTSTKKDLLIHIGILLSLSAIIVLVFFFVYLPARTRHGESITVPDLTGMNVMQLEEFLNEKDLRFEADSDYVSNRPPLSVITQYPKAGSKVKEGRKIYVTIVAKNPPMVPMPNLVDFSLRSAQMVLQSAGLEAGELIYKPDLCQNCVLAQQVKGGDIKPGTRIPKGTKVDLVLGDGAGNQEFPVPNLIGKTLEEAKVILSGSDLVQGSIIYEQNSEKPVGTVFKQNPPAVEGNKIRMGEIVDLWVVGSPDNNNATPEGVQ